jgi:hypothetical protein
VTICDRGFSVGNILTAWVRVSHGSTRPVILLSIEHSRTGKTTVAFPRPFLIAYSKIRNSVQNDVNIVRGIVFQVGMQKIGRQQWRVHRITLGRSRMPERNRHDESRDHFPPIAV